MADRWSLERIDWSELRPELVEPRFLKLAKTSSLVEYNAADYVEYLCKVFNDDAEIQESIHRWGEEERQHGLALKLWVERIDPSFDFESALERFRSAYRIPLNVSESVRGSRSGELVARCMVEVGTSSYYAALRDACEEPVFKKICQWISTDEIQHFNLFYRNLERYLSEERLGKFARMRVALGRSMEVEDEELSFAFAAANLDEEIRIDRLPEYNKGFLSEAYGIYQIPHMSLATRLAFKAAGIRSRPWMHSLAAKTALGLMHRRQKKLNAA